MREEGRGNREQGLVKVLFWILAVGAVCVLGAAAVWMGGLNQDEGWYLYAANLVAEGKVPYRDFQYTQGPLMPCLYSLFVWVWNGWGLLGARVFTLTIGLCSVLIFARTAADLVGEKRKWAAALTVVFLLGCNLYHLYYIAIPKTYALASFFVACGFRWLIRGMSGKSYRRLAIVPLPPMLSAGLFLACAAGTRISLGAILCAVGCWFLFRREWKNLVWFCVGGFLGLGLVYGLFLLDQGAFAGLVAAQKYHTARGGFDLVFTVGSFSRLVRWYLPVFVVLGLALFPLGRKDKSCSLFPVSSSLFPLPCSLLLWSFLAVFAVQMLAPFPYEDYQVPVMGLLALYAAVRFSSCSLFPVPCSLFLVLALSFAASFGSPLLEKWMTNGQDRFWSLKKEKCELAQLRDVAKRIEELDPNGKTLLTQDLYLAIETNRKVPKGLEMGPFAILTDVEWKRLVVVTAPAECRIAALSGYSFAIEPPICKERSLETQLEYWSLLKRNYELVEREESFGQNATSLMILKRK